MRRLHRLSEDLWQVIRCPDKSDLISSRKFQALRNLGYLDQWFPDWVVFQRVAGRSV
jgi:hypothetical protein